MAKLRLWRNNKSKDYKFIDDSIGQWFHVGGTGMYVHKYLGIKNNKVGEDGTCDDDSFSPTCDKDLDELNIQDVLLLENRDRRYDRNVIELDGVYTLSDKDFTLSQFGIVTTDTLYIDFHINKMMERLGRKLIAGDVLELLHKRDDLVLDENQVAVNAFYVIKDAQRPAEGYSQTWRGHLWRVRAEPIKDSQEFKDIIANCENDIFTNKDILDGITDAIESMANREVNTENFDSHHFYYNPHNTDDCCDGGDTLIPWVFNGDNIPFNSNTPAPQGKRWPETPLDGDYFLRTDYNPARLFRWDTCKWVHVETAWREKPYHAASKTITDFLNNTDTVQFNENPNDDEDSRQSITDVVSPDDKGDGCQAPFPENIADDEDDANG